MRRGVAGTPRRRETTLPMCISPTNGWWRARPAISSLMTVHSSRACPCGPMTASVACLNGVVNSAWNGSRKSARSYIVVAGRM